MRVGRGIEVDLAKRTAFVRMTIPFGASYRIQQPAAEVIAQMTALSLAALKLGQGQTLQGELGVGTPNPQPQDSDYIYPLFRALDAGLIEDYWIDFSRPGVVKASMPLLEGQTIFTNHGRPMGIWGCRQLDINDWVGAVNQVLWDEKGEQSGGIAGINTELKVDWTIDPKLARGLLMKPPAVHAVSCTPYFGWDASHPELLEQGSFFRNLGLEVEGGVATPACPDGKLVRLIANELVDYREISFVVKGANAGSNRPIEPDESDEELSAVRARLHEVLRAEFGREDVFGDVDAIVELAASGATDWPLSDRNASWDASAAEPRLRKWASHDDSGTKDKMDWKKYNRVFFWHESTKALNFGSYKLPFCDVVDGKVTATWSAITAAAAAIQGSRGGVQIPDADKPGVKRRIESYYAKARKQYGDSKIQVPWKNEGTQQQSADELADRENEDNMKIKLTAAQKKALGLENEAGDEFEDSVLLSALARLEQRAVTAETALTVVQPFIDAERAEVVRLATLVEGVTGEDTKVTLPAVFSEAIKNATPAQLADWKTMYQKRVDEKFPPKCAKCGSLEMSRRSSVEEAANSQAKTTTRIPRSRL